jgi:ubiquinone biosynthesis protein COQ4
MDRPGGAGHPSLAYLGKRLTQTHDFWHVLSGYNRDPVGELGMLAFTLAQTRSRGIGFILAVVVWRSAVERWHAERRPWTQLIPYLWRAWWAGRRAHFLPALMLEDLFPLPLDSARSVLEIEPLRHSFSPEALPPIPAVAPALPDPHPARVEG